MTINLRKLGCAAVGSGLFLGGVYVGTKLTKENLTKVIEKVLYDDQEPLNRRRSYSNYYSRTEGVDGDLEFCEEFGDDCDVNYSIPKEDRMLRGEK